jgi:hypothetical protein
LKKAESFWRRLNDVDVKLSQKRVIVMSLMGLLYLSRSRENSWKLERTFQTTGTSEPCGNNSGKPNSEV